jgi:hypothetical protein
MDKKLGNMKSHDWHVLMQQFMPLALRGLMDTNVCLSLMRLSQVFRNICAKVWDPTSLLSLREDVVVTLSMIEWELLDALFDVMTHLVLHVVEELAICGPIHSKWMYPIEQTLGTLKKCVHKWARLEASMVSGYVLDETLGFVTEYMQMFTQYVAEYGMLTRKKGCMVKYWKGLDPSSTFYHQHKTLHINMSLPM